MTEAASGPNVEKKINDALESYFKELNRMFCAETLLSYIDWTITFTVHSDASDKQLGAVISQSNKPIANILKKIYQATTCLHYDREGTFCGSGMPQEITQNSIWI